MTIIPGLPAELREVPPPPISPDDPERDRKRADWLAWRERVLRWRAERTPRINADPTLQRIELALCAQHPAYFLTAWGWLYEPRPAKLGGGYKPFIPFASQVDLIDAWLWCLQQEDENADLLLSKCRDMAASWTFCGIADWGWLFHQPHSVLMISRKADLVDSKAWKSLFKKARCILSRLPAWMMPAGFDWKLHSQQMILINPATDNQITGETTTTAAGTADRVAWMLIDEGARVPDLLQTYAVSGDSTDHRAVVSTETFEEGPDFWRLGIGGKEEVRPYLVEHDWWLNPFHDDAWFARQRKRYASRPEAFASEVLRDPRAALGSTWVYPAAESITPDPELRYKPGAPLIVGIDPGFRDETAIVWLQDDPVTGHMHVLDAYQNKNVPADFYGTLLTGEMQSGEWDYDAEELRIIAFTAPLPRATYYGDVYGNNTLGATLDTFYSRLRKFGLFVNCDRMEDGSITSDRMQARTFRGRREALRELLPRLRFADTPGALLALRSLQEHRFKNDDKPVMSEPNKPLHDWTSHLVAALEYVAVNLKLRRQAASRIYKPAQKATMLPKLPQPARWPTQNRMVG